MLRICLRRKIVARDHDAQALGFFGLIGEIKASGQDRDEMLRTRTYCHCAILSQNGEQEPDKNLFNPGSSANAKSEPPEARRAFQCDQQLW